MGKTKKHSKSQKIVKKKSKKVSINRYDTIIVGGGISGLNTAYQIIKTHPTHRILIIEGSNRLGGRLNTIKYKGTQYEAGGARFNNKHSRLLKLLNDFNLDSKKVPIPSDTYFRPYPKDYMKSIPYIDKFVNSKGIIDIYSLIKEIILLKQKGEISYKELINHSLLDLVDKKLDAKYPKIKQVFENVFEYWSEIAVLNSHDAIQLFKNDFNTKIQFYILKSGLSDIINNLVEYIKKHKVDIKKNYYLDKIVKTDNDNEQGYQINVLKNYQEPKVFETKNLVLAIQQKDLLKIKYLTRHQKISKLLNTVSHQPLYRIYARYPVINGKVWFKNVPKICTNLHIKFIIPYDYEKGLIMISYTDGKVAKYWNDKLAAGEDILMNQLNNDLKKLFPDIKIPNPLWVKHHYWSSGAAYWKTGVESNKIIPQIIEPFGKKESIYICGENFSNHQAWMEGALQTSELVVSELNKNIKNQEGGNQNSSKKPISNKSKSKSKSKKNTKSKLKKSKSKKTKKLNKYTIKEVEKHNKKSDAWLIINKKVYDVTKWIDKHPGGMIIMKGVGKDATEMFRSIGHSSNAKKILKGLQIGILI